MDKLYFVEDDDEGIREPTEEELREHLQEDDKSTTR